ncbi:hypothetical protein [Streptomyces zhihengii]|uniref:hypothetical protein n=1 Tax=Streptomyces zhihengii TaxID=1818004 RepID=UPI0033B7EEC0
MMNRLVREAGGPCEPAADMADLAELLRNLLAVTRREDTPVRLGGNLFDVVVTSSSFRARAAVDVMDAIQGEGGCGPAIEDTRDGSFYWLVPPGTDERWPQHTHAVCLGAPYRITLPSLDSTSWPSVPGPYWYRPSRSDRLVPAFPLWKTLARHQPEPTPHAAFEKRLGGAL